MSSVPTVVQLHDARRAWHGLGTVDAGHAHVTQHTITCTLAHGGFRASSAGTVVLRQRGSISPPPRHCHHRGGLGTGEGPRRPDAPRRLSDVGTTVPCLDPVSTPIRIEAQCHLCQVMTQRLRWAPHIGVRQQSVGASSGGNGAPAWRCSLLGGLHGIAASRLAAPSQMPPPRGTRWHVPRFALGDVPRRRFPLVGHLAAAVEGRGRGNVG